MTAPQIFALLVGIDKYVSSNIPNLSGCVADAQSMQKYLVDSLAVPMDHILLLTDDNATRQAILQAFQTHFINNDRITKGNAMLFYFAGHGSQFNAPAGWTTDDRKVETITPHDQNVETEVFGIPDRTLFALFNKTAEVRGNNITTVLDCCHSGSGTRGGMEGTVRGHDNVVTIPADLDREILGNVTNRQIRHASPWAFRGGGMSSHVLLAACRQDEEARELKIDNGSTAGIFTHQLIKAMRQSSARQTTYADLLDLLPPLPKQHPQCEGDNKHCFLFTTLRLHDDRFFKVQKSTAGVVVQAGEVHGVTDGTEFVLYEDANSASLSFGLFKATAVGYMSSVLGPKPPTNVDNVPDVSYALVSRWPDAKLTVFAEARTLSMATLEAINRKMSASASIIRASMSTNADIILHDVDGEPDLVRFNSVMAGQLGMPLRTQIKVARDHIAHALQSAAHFKFHLVRTNKLRPLRDRVTIELYQLAEVGDGSHLPTGDNLICDGQARIILSDNLYGVTLRNDSDYDLFPSLFYFCLSDFSIQSCYVPPSSTMAAPLRHKSALTVGHGNNDGQAIEFDIQPGDGSETGFLVLFLSTQYADMTHIQQSSVLDGSSGRAPKMHKQQLRIWDRALATVTVARTSADFPSRSPAMPSSSYSWLSSFFRGFRLMG